MAENRRRRLRDLMQPSKEEIDAAKTAGSAGQYGGAIGTGVGTVGGAIAGGLIGGLPTGGAGALPGAGLGAGIGGTLGGLAGTAIGNYIGDGAEEKLRDAEEDRQAIIEDEKLRDEALAQLMATR